MCLYLKVNHWKVAEGLETYPLSYDHAFELTHFKFLRSNAHVDTRRPDGRKKKSRQDPERTARTVFVGNLPPVFNEKKLKAHFKQFGEIESTRFRSMASLCLCLVVWRAFVLHLPLLYIVQVNSISCGGGW